MQVEQRAMPILTKEKRWRAERSLSDASIREMLEAGYRREMMAWPVHTIRTRKMMMILLLR
jgi:hypothetical protein